MSVKVKVDGSGRMVIPARLRRELGIGEEGGEVVLGDGPMGLTLTPDQADRQPPVVDELGLVVLDVGREVGANEVSDAMAADRDRREPLRPA